MQQCVMADTMEEPIVPIRLGLNRLGLELLVSRPCVRNRQFRNVIFFVTKSVVCFIKQQTRYRTSEIFKFVLCYCNARIWDIATIPS